ncbi:MAG: deoxyribonuclease IV [Candidatus Aminicenantes bacterium]|nr:deoxyribonuclease IV [Candidatus Aminicenantes bacterium]
MKYIGAHVSAAGGVENAPLRAEKIGAKAFALFTKNQKQWQAPPLSVASIAAFKRNLVSAAISPCHVLPHDSYLINLGHPDPEKREKSILALLDEARRVEMLGLNYLNFHPGSHLGLMEENKCLKTIAVGMKRILAETGQVSLLLETTSGQGGYVGYRFEHLATILEQVNQKERTGVCLDTCHIFAAGYDIRTAETYEKTMKRFDEIIGGQYLLAAHVNDSKVDLGSRKDRHDSIGRGKLGMEAFRMMMNDPRFEDLPLILETIDDSLWESEIKLLYSLVDPNSPVL